MPEDQQIRDSDSYRAKDDNLLMLFGVLFILGGVFLPATSIPTAGSASALLLSLGTSSFIHRFLGGITASFKYGKMISATGALVAVLGGYFFVFEPTIRSELKRHIKEASDLDFQPSNETWIPISRNDGRPILVKLEGFEGVINPINDRDEIETGNYQSIRFSHDLDIDGKKVLREKLQVGQIDEEKLKNSVSLNPSIVPDSLRTSDAQRVNSMWTPPGYDFKIRTKRYAGSPDRVVYELLDQSDRIIGGDREISASAQDVYHSFIYNRSSYFLTVRDACFKAERCLYGASYVQFVVGMLDPGLALKNK